MDIVWTGCSPVNANSRLATGSSLEDPQEPRYQSLKHRGFSHTRAEVFVPQMPIKAPAPSGSEGAAADEEPRTDR